MTTDQLPDDAWIDRGLCKETDPEAFYPERGENVKAAKATCRACDVTAECLAYAITHRERHGIWGGLTERQRRKHMPREQVPA